MDIERPSDLISYLTSHGHVDAGTVVETRVLEGGVSNRTVLAQWRTPEGHSRAWVLKQALERLRVAVDWRSSPERIHREAAGMRALGDLVPAGAVPQLILEDSVHHLLAMTAVDPPHACWRDQLLAGDVDVSLAQQFGSLLGSIHRESMRRSAVLEPDFRDRSFFESLRVEPYYLYTAERCPEAGPFLTQLVADTRACRIALVHGDYSPKNILVKDGRLVLLDHEVIHWGDPSFDVGFATTHLLSKANHLPAYRSSFLRAAATMWGAYRETLGAVDAEMDERCVRQTLGCLLARVDGRSPLGYLTDAQRVRQRAAVLLMIRARPVSMDALLDGFPTAMERVTHASDR